MIEPSPILLGAEWIDHQPGGLNRYFADLFDALARDKRSHQSALVIGPTPDGLKGVFGVSSTETGLARRLEKFGLLANRLAGPCDVVNAHFALYAAAAMLHRNIRKRPLVFTFHGPWSDESASERGAQGPAGFIKSLVEKIVLRRADHIVVLSTAFKDLLVDKFAIDSERITVVAPGVDTDRFHPGDTRQARRALDLPADGMVVVSPRRLVARMGLDRLIEAWSALSRSEDDRLVIVGDGPERNALEALAKGAGVGDSVRFAGRVSDEELVSYYQAADVVAVPSIELEGYGLVVLEAAACATPVIATDVGGLGEAAAALSPDCVIASAEPRLLVEALERTRSGEVIDAAVCRQHALDHSWDAVGAKYRSIFRDVVEASRPMQAAGHRPRVAVLTHSSELAGAEIAVARLGSAIQGSVDMVFLLASHGPLCDELERRGLAYEVLPIPGSIENERRAALERPGLRHLSQAASVARYGSVVGKRLKELDVDLVQSSSLKAHVYGAVAARIARRPLAWYLHDRVDEDYLPRPAVALLRQLAKRSTVGIMANSRASLRTVPGSTIVREVVGCPVELPAQPRRSLRTGHEGTLVFGIVGRLAPWKGQEVGLRAFAEAFAGQPGMQCRVIGDALFGESEYADSLRQLVEQLGIEAQVEFRGHCDDMAAEYGELDAVVHCSIIPEPLGLVVVEAQAHGVPVIAAEAGGVLETVKHDIDGLLFEPGSASSLAQAMRQLASTPALRERLTTAGPEAAAAFAPATVAAAADNFYRKSIEHARHQW